jgi:hypothetical protein
MRLTRPAINAEVWRRSRVQSCRTLAGPNHTSVGGSWRRPERGRPYLGPALPLLPAIARARRHRRRPCRPRIGLARQRPWPGRLPCTMALSTGRHGNKVSGPPRIEEGGRPNGTSGARARRGTRAVGACRGVEATAGSSTGATTEGSDATAAAPADLQATFIQHLLPTNSFERMVPTVQTFP